MALPRLIFVTGKGGTGKSTVAAALATALARLRPTTLADLGGRQSALRLIGLKATDASVASSTRANTQTESPANSDSTLDAVAITPQGELETIAVAAGDQRRGVARRLFAAMVEKLRVAQVTEVMLEVRASNCPALAFYHAQGFVETGRRPRYYADSQEDALLLGLRLK